MVHLLLRGAAVKSAVVWYALGTVIWIYGKFNLELRDTLYSNYKKEPAETIPMICIDDIVLGINKDMVKCNLCHEEFDQVYINDQDLQYKINLQQGKLKDGWYLKNAIWTGSSDVVHPTCLNE